VLRSSHGPAYRRNVVHNSGAGVDLHDENRLDAASVAVQAALDLGLARGMAPVAFKNLNSGPSRAAR
jgi:hypothetical protein